VPIELTLAVHSDAGYVNDGVSIYGSLAICTTDFNEGKLNAGISRQASYNLAQALLNNVTTDMQYKYGRWAQRDLFDRNYSETRLPDVPSAILETLSHQSFPDMTFGQDPSFRFSLARSIYKTLLRYINDQHGTSYMVTPLTPDNFRIEFASQDKIRLSWNAVKDPQEPTAEPSGYIVYTAVGDADFDNGTYVRSKTSYELQLEPNILYHFKVAAVNRGGRSFTTEVLSALCNPLATQTVMIVNGFHRLSSPAIRNNGLHQGFDLDEDPGVTYGPTLGWLGRQLNFDRTQMGNENGGLGDSSDELAGMLIAGNDFNYVMTHAEAIRQAGNYNIVSCSGQAVSNGAVQLSNYQVVDLLLGLERNDGHSLNYYKTFDSSMQQALRNYMSQGGRLLVSGAYTGSDMLTDSERSFMASVLHCQYAGRSLAPTNEVKGLGTNMYFYKNLNEEHYAAISTDILQPVKPAITAMLYADGYGAATAYKGTDCRSFVMGFPFECIKTSQKRSSIMQGILNYLIK
ncbi:MAG: fibronectin type III domain-containing protein, partial [Prevotella sp.]|nr:fibronectin type III domain-containing protein [Prevotella sp.]